MHLKATIDTLVMEDEAYVQSFYMAWMFFPIFIFIGIGQVILFVLYNNKYHPFQIILKGATKKGKMTFTWINSTLDSKMQQNTTQWCALAISSPLGVGQSPVENSRGSYKIKNVAQKKLV